MHHLDEKLRAQTELLAVEIEAIGAAVERSLAISTLLNMRRVKSPKRSIFLNQCLTYG
jgi:hypothetical protein